MSEMNKNETIKQLLCDCEWSITRNREKWLARTSGPHWSDLKRFVKLFDLSKELLAELAALKIEAMKQVWECPKCQSVFEDDGKDHPAGILCPECKRLGYVSVGILQSVRYKITQFEYDALKNELAALKDQIHDLVHDKLALKAAQAWHPASEPPDSNGEEEIQIIGKARYWKSTHPLNNPWGHIEITGWRELPAG